MALSFGRSRRNQKDGYALVQRMRRSLDLVWELEEGEVKIMLTLMPLAAASGRCKGYLEPHRAALQDQFGVDFVAARIKPHHSSVGGGHARAGAGYRHHRTDQPLMLSVKLASLAVALGSGAVAHC